MVNDDAPQSRASAPGQHPDDAPKQTASADKPRDGLSFVHSSLDDAGLEPAEFRVYCHVNRRAGRRGVCNESLSNIAAHCGYGDDTTRDALKILSARQMLRRKEISGIGVEYRLNIPACWINAPAPLQKKRSGAKSKACPVKKSKPHPSEKIQAKGIPSEGIPTEGSNSKSHSLQPDKPTRENELMKLAVEVLGKPVMDQWGGVWRKRVRAKSGKVERVLNAVRADQKNGVKPRKDWGAYANDLWGRFAD